MAKQKRGRATDAKTPPRTLEVPYRRQADFRFIPADGALVRVHPNGVTIGFYIDDMRVVSQPGELIEAKAGFASYKAGPLKEEMGRVEQVAVRMAPADAMSLAALIQQKLQEVQTASRSAEQAIGGPKPAGEKTWLRRS